MTQYLVLIYEREADYASAGPEMWNTMMDAHNAFAKAVSDLGATILGGNALHFLGLLPLGTDPSVGWAKNRERLQRFYRDNNINPPDWFSATG